MENKAETEMPKYVSHKEVWALKVKEVQRDYAWHPDLETDGGATLVPDDERYAPFKVDAAYMRKHQPHVGGFYVVYPDGYKSFSPAGAFEAGYTLIK